MREGFGFGLVLCLVAVVIFCLAAFGAHPGDWSSARLVALGLAFFAASTRIP